ncbi:CidA/LrgA family protein [Ureibacillus terrenus]|uniref:CidA/LrgA family protein n=2 Tax=Caryophanaceae TaxID=186818 RepID=A0A540UZ28_9BACL|nr:CidA/LrgA family protein [Ureibacillus terrenus]
MKVIRIVAQVLLLYIFYYAGVLIVDITHLPLPASIIGMVLLFICLHFKWIKVDYIKEGANFLIAFMTLFFIPPIIGIIDYPQLISVSGTLLLASVIISTLFVLLTTGIISQWIEKKELEMKEKKEKGEAEHAGKCIHH